jgi:hypothetical protein
MMNLVSQMLNVRLDLDKETLGLVGLAAVRLLATLLFLSCILGLFDDPLSSFLNKKIDF